jgi:hypothetical protein
MGKGSGSAPSAPDPQELTQAQSKANIDAILASQFVNSTPTFTPFGSQQFYVSPTGQYSQVQARRNRNWSGWPRATRSATRCSTVR